MPQLACSNAVGRVSLTPHPTSTISSLLHRRWTRGPCRSRSWGVSEATRTSTSHMICLGCAGLPTKTPNRCATYGACAVQSSWCCEAKPAWDLSAQARSPCPQRSVCCLKHVPVGRGSSITDLVGGSRDFLRLLPAASSCVSSNSTWPRRRGRIGRLRGGSRPVGQSPLARLGRVKPPSALRNDAEDARREVVLIQTRFRQWGKSEAPGAGGCKAQGQGARALAIGGRMGSRFRGATRAVLTGEAGCGGWGMGWRLPQPGRSAAAAPPPTWGSESGALAEHLKTWDS